MSLRFDEQPEQEPLSHEVDNEVVTTTTQPTIQTSANPKLIAIFAIPMLLVAMGLQFGKSKIDLINDSDNLASRVAAAKKAGFPFTAQELEGAAISDSENAFPVYKKLFWDSNRPTSDERTHAIRLWDLDKKPMPIGVQRAVSGMREVLKRKSYRSPVDWDLGKEAEIDDFGSPASLKEQLCYAAMHYARHGQSESAVEALDLSMKATQLATTERNLISEYKIADFDRTFRSIAYTAHELRGNKTALAKLKEVASHTIRPADLASFIRGEFYLNLSTIRKVQGMEDFADPGPRYDADGNEIIEPPKPPAPIQREGLPKSAFSQALLSRTIDNFLELEKARLSSPDVMEAAKAMDVVRLKINSDPTTDKYKLGHVFEYEGIAGASMNARVVQELTRWALDIETNYNGNYPASLPPKVDPIFGGKLIYRKIKDGYALYSTGFNKLDDGGMRAFRDKSKKGDTDDIGLKLPIRIAPKPKPDKNGRIPGGPPLFLD